MSENNNFQQIAHGQNLKIRRKQETMNKTKDKESVETIKLEIESIRQSIIDGNKKVTSEDLASARSRLEFAELRQEAAVIRKEENIHKDRKAELLKLQDRLTEIHKSKNLIDKKFENFVKSFNDYLGAIVVYSHRLQEIKEELSDGAFLADQRPIEEITLEVGSKVKIGEGFAEHIDPRETINKLVERRLGELGGELRTHNRAESLAKFDNI